MLVQARHWTMPNRTAKHARDVPHGNEQRRHQPIRSNAAAVLSRPKRQTRDQQPRKRRRTTPNLHAERLAGRTDNAPTQDNRRHVRRANQNAQNADCATLDYSAP